LSTAEVEIKALRSGEDRTQYPYHGPGRRWRGRAFGLTVEARAPIAGMRSAQARDERRVQLTLLAPGELEASWRASEATSLFRQPLPDGGPALTLERHEQQGYRVFAHGYGAWLVAADGSAITGAPPDGLEVWLWERFLTGQVLPFAALLQGLEVFHASAVVLEERVVAVTAGSGVGKTSVALNLVVRGARLFTDDVLAAEPGPGPVCQPGTGAANVRDARLTELAERPGSPLGRICGRGSQSLRVLLDCETRALPLGALYFLEREREEGELRFEPIADPYRLLASTFNFVIRTPERLGAQLDTCARIAHAAPMVRVLCPRDTTAARVADALENHARGLLTRSPAPLAR
jgi:hypothetical protein